ncbi:hypothetical protein NDU88_007908 [Pleurodeles waltl]|uniref:Uncharacterized protein n=1 Tax=Pleurodeles waltl TaxID=8319 RepID=A0AAV7N3D5_PLEWA|nr:hypothetical protein NDU88_007908 [Pleurodeles waltl]
MKAGPHPYVHPALSEYLRLMSWASAWKCVEFVQEVPAETRTDTLKRLGLDRFVEARSHCQTQWDATSRVCFRGYREPVRGPLNTWAHVVKSVAVLGRAQAQCPHAALGPAPSLLCLV